MAAGCDDDLDLALFWLGLCVFDAIVNASQSIHDRRRVAESLKPTLKRPLREPLLFQRLCVMDDLCQ